MSLNGNCHVLGNSKKQLKTLRLIGSYNTFEILKLIIGIAIKFIYIFTFKNEGIMI